MKLITLDFETYYDQKTYSLSKKETTMEDYLNDPRFQVIGMGWKVNDGPVSWIDNSDGGVYGALDHLDLKNNCVVCHNAKFDGSILGWKYGIHPKMLLCTQNMARFVHRDPRRSLSLANLSVFHAIGQKGTEVVHASGMRLEDFSAEQLSRYGEYCRNDVELTFKLFQLLMKRVPENELHVIDLSLRMFTRPTLRLDHDILEWALKDEQKRRRDVLDKLTAGASVEKLKKVLRSRDNMAKLLRGAGVDPPMKISADTGEPTYAFAKTDKVFTDLLKHPSPRVRALVECKLEVSSSIEETRLQRMLDIDGRTDGVLPVPLKYYGALTGRYSGEDKINMQNLPRKSRLRDALIAPEGHQLIVSDASQIEARLMAHCAGQQDMTEQFRQGIDVYCAFGEQVFGREITKADILERFMCKVSILQLQYGSSAKRFYHSLTDGSQGMVAKISPDEAHRIHAMYRSTYKNITQFWRRCDNMLKSMVTGGQGVLSEDPVITWKNDEMYLPGDMVLRYTGIHLKDKDMRYVRHYNGGTSKIYGSMSGENIMQTLARVFIMECLVRIMNRVRALGLQMHYAMQVHDELVFIAPDAHIHMLRTIVHEEMSTPPTWAPDLPVAAETEIGLSYGTAK